MKDYRKEAREWLGYLRKGSGSYESFLKYLRQDVAKGGLSLEDIGTSKEELKKLKKKPAKE